MNPDLYQLADEHLRDENELVRGVLGVEESALRVAVEVIRDLRAGRAGALPGAPPADDAPDVEWLDWLIGVGGLRLFQDQGLRAETPRLFEAA